MSVARAPALEGAEPSAGKFLIYGAYGYTGELIARDAARRGMPAILAGRSAGLLEPLAQELGLESRVFSLDDPTDVDAGLEGVQAVLGCAGPFESTWEPLAAACLRKRVHYLDITGEIAVFAGLHAWSDRARDAGVMLLPGAGFDVVPSDCLAAFLAAQVPGAIRLRLAFAARGGVSRGTATTAVRKLGEGGCVRRGGELTLVPAAWQTLCVDFGNGPRKVVSIPWGDVYTAFVTTGIPAIETYFAAGWGTRMVLRSSRVLGWLYRRGFVRSALRKLVRSGKPGPSAEQRERGATYIWGEATDAAGRQVCARLAGPEGYSFTVATALACMERVLAGSAPPGYQTPATAYGADFVLGIPGVTRR